MTDCPDGLIRDLLPEYARGVLGAEDAARVAAHLAGCEACAAELVLLQRVCAVLSVNMSRVDVAAIVAALPAPPIARPRLRRTMGRRAWEYAAAAGLVLAVGSGIVWRTASDRSVVRLADSLHVRTSPGAESTQPPAVRPEDGITFGGGLEDLSVNDLKALLGQMDSVRTLPSTDPESMTPVIAMNEGGETL